MKRLLLLAAAFVAVVVACVVEYRRTDSLKVGIGAQCTPTLTPTLTPTP